MDDIHVSVIVPMFNAARYIEHCALSLFHQSYSKIDFVFVDDGSSDDTVALLRNVLSQFPELESRTSIIELGNNMGVATARQTGLDAAKGDFVSFVDADDYIPEDFIMNMCGAARSQSLDIVICDHIYVYSDRKVRVPTAKASSVDQFRALLMQGSIHAGLCNKLVKKSLFDAHHLRFSFELRVLEDKVMMVKLFYFASSIGHCDATVYFYNKTNENSLTTQAKAKQAMCFVPVWNEVADFFSDKTLTPLFALSMEYFRIGLLGTLLYFGPKDQNSHRGNSLFDRPRVAHVLRQPVIPYNYKLIITCYALRLNWAVILLRMLRHKLKR